MAAEGESDKMPSDTEVHVKRKCGNGFLHTEKMSAIDIHRHLPNVYKDQTVGVNTVMQWVIAHLNSWYCSVKDKKKRKKKKSHALDSHAQLPCCKIKSVSISSYTQTGSL